MTQEQATTEIVVQKNTFLSNPMIEALKKRKEEMTKIAEAGKGLTIKGIDDKDGFQKVHDAEQACIKARTQLDKDRKVITRVLDEAKDFVMDIQKDLVSITLPVEEALKAEKTRIAELKEQVRLEAERKAKEKLNHRVEELAKVNATHDLFDLEMMEEVEFLALLSEKETAYKVEQERIAKEAEEKAKYEAERASFEAEKAKLEAEKQAMEAEKNKIAREAELKKAQEEAAEKSRIETEARMKREQEEAEAKRIADEKAKAEQEAKEKAEFEAQAQFIGWLKENGLNETNRSEFKITDENGVKVLWKRVSSYQA